MQVKNLTEDPKSLEVVFATQLDKDIMEQYRPRMMIERTKIQDPKMKTQMKLSIAPEMVEKFTALQKITEKLREAKEVNGVWRELATKLTYNQTTWKDFQIQ